MKSFAQLKNELDAGKLQNFYVFTGKEKEVMRKYIKRIGPDAKTIETLDSLWKNMFNTGLFSTGDKTFVMYNNKEIMELDLKEIVRSVGSHTLILVYDSIDKRTKFFKKVSPFITEFEKFTSEQLAGIVQKRFPDIPDLLAQLIAQYSNNEVGRLELELDKLDNLPEGTKINILLVRSIMTMPAEDKIFEMIDSVAKKDIRKSVMLYEDLLELKESPIKIVSLLYTKFKQVFLVQSYKHLSNSDISKQTGIGVYPINFARDLIGHFSDEQLVQIMQKIQQTEVAMKTGQIDIQMGMDTLLIDILK